MGMEIVEIADIVLSVAATGMAASQIADTWVNGGIFRRPQKWLRKHRERFLGELLTCPFCLSHWLVLAGLAICLLTDRDSLTRIPIYLFAAVKVAVLLLRDEEVTIDQTAEVDGIEVMDEDPQQSS